MDNRLFSIVKRRGVMAVFDECLLPFADQMIEGVDDMMAGGIILKTDYTCDVSMAVIGGIRVIIKRYNNKGLIHTLRHNCKMSRARRCWIWAQRLLDAGLSTPASLGYMEVYECGLRQRSYLFTEYLEGRDFAEALKDACDENERARLSQAVDEMVNALEHKRILHNDLKPPNVMIVGSKPYLIDLDSIRRITFLTAPFDRNKDRSHLVRKLARQGVITDERFNMIAVEK